LAIHPCAVHLRAWSVAWHTRQLPPGLATRLSMGADVTTAVPAVVGVIESRTALLLRGDGATVSPCTNQSRGGALGAVIRASSACSHASHSSC